jgi:hypothetical protein
MDWIEAEPFGLVCPDFADELIGCETFEDLEPAAEIVCGDEVDPTYCLIYECYPDGALAAVDPISTDRP